MKRNKVWMRYLTTGVLATALLTGCGNQAESQTEEKAVEVTVREKTETSADSKVADWLKSIDF